MSPAVVGAQVGLFWILIDFFLWEVYFSIPDKKKLHHKYKDEIYELCANILIKIFSCGRMSSMILAFSLHFAPPFSVTTLKTLL